MAEFSDKAAFALVLVSGIVIPGVLTYYTSVFLGQPIIGQVVWVVGYIGMVLVIWQYWLRPLDFEGPERDSEERERNVKD